MLTRQILLSTLLGLTVHAPDAVAQPTTACAVRLVVVDPNGVTLAARVDVLEPESGDVDATMAACIRAGTGVRRIRLMISADGYQPHATDTIEIDPAAARDVVVTLMPPFSESLTVEGRGANMVGIAESASAGVVGANDLASRPLVRAGDIIEAVPGVAMTQHSSGGHAPIILLRGYNLDHGTDFATALEGAPLNLPSHAHAQGYTDTNFLIEDVVGRIEFQKGPYSARTGNFSTAGSANIELAETLERPVLRVEGGGNGFARVMAAGSVARGTRRAMAAFEASHDDGPSEVPDDFTRWKALAKYSAGDEARRLSMTFAGYRASWFATDGYPQRALDRGYLTRFGTLDASDGGRTQQYMLVASSRRTDDRQHLDIGAYGRYYDLDLFSNLTFWTRSPESGDQIWQADRRTSIGGHAISSRFLGRRAGAVEVTAGAQVRHDLARVRLRNTVDRVPQAKTVLSGAPLPAVVYDDRIADTSMSPFADLRLRPLAWLRANIGVRADTVRMRVVSDRTENSGTTWASIVTPKASVILGPWRATEIYANAGSGFHSNHAAGVMQRVDPLTGSAIRADGTIVAGSPPLVRTVGAEAGSRTELGTILRTSIALWLLDSDSELIYTAEDGVTSPERPGRRYGIEWLNVLQLRSWIGADLDAAWSHARYRTDPLREGRLIPDAAAAVVGGGVTVSRSRIGAAIRARYVGRRPLLPSGHSFVEGSSIVNGQAEVRVSSRVRINVQAFNIFDRRYEDTAYYFATRLRDPNTGIVEHDAVGDYVTHPGQPRTVRAGLRIVF